MSVDPAALLADLKPRVKELEVDLRDQATNADVAWSNQLKREYAEALSHERTARTWSQWLSDEVTQAAVAWVLATVFVRFCEDNQLFDGPWISGPDEQLSRAIDNENDYYAHNPTHNARDWLEQAFGALAKLPAGRALVDPEHNPVWRAPISADAARHLLRFWQRRDDDGLLVHDLSDPNLETRFLGDLYQELSEDAQSRFALLQTPEFIERFILDRTLEPAVDEFGLNGLRLVDPACGSGHFLLGAFDRLNDKWAASHPDMLPRQRVQQALSTLHGVDLNPFAVAITRFRLTVAALAASGDRRLDNAPAFELRIAIGDALLAARAHDEQGTFDDGFTYSSEDVAEFGDILAERSFHVVIGNPPYITVKDKAANAAYRRSYGTCKGKYALSVPFAELFFRLARKADSLTGAGYVGQITSNSFMKREFGTKLIEEFLSGATVDLTHVIDTSGAYIPGHGTPTVILIGRPRYPHSKSVRAVLGIRGEPGQPDNPVKGYVWNEIVDHIAEADFEGEYVSVTDLPRESLAKHPWSLSGGGATELFEVIEDAAAKRVKAKTDSIGFAAVTGDDEVFVRRKRSGPLRQSTVPTRWFIEGERVRDFETFGTDVAIFPYPVESARKSMSVFWPYRTQLQRGLAFGNTREDRDQWWGEYILPNFARLSAEKLITFAFVATHNHFVLDRGGKVFKQSAPVIKLPADASENDHYDLLGVLNSSLACFWLKQVCHAKGVGGVNQESRSEMWEGFYEFTGTKLEQFPLPGSFPRERARRLDSLAQELSDTSPEVVAVDELDQAHQRWQEIRQQMIAEQEELDWQTYELYGLLDEDLTYNGEPPLVQLGERAFEIALARRMAEGLESSEWFNRHDSVPRITIPEHWPEDYRSLVQRRLDVIEDDKQIKLLERPEYKRRWSTDSWQSQQDEALRTRILDRLEDPELWRDGLGPVTRSVAELADLVRHDGTIVAELSAWTGHQDVDLVPALTSLLKDEAVPGSAAHRFKEPGMVKYREWQHIWQLQRREDAGENVDIPVPPKYKRSDFRGSSYWRARGKLDVPKERFISYPGAARTADTSPLLGWAGWNHAEQAQALARLFGEQRNIGANDDELTVLLTGLAELEPWLHQWHADIDQTIGVSPAASISGFLDQQLTQLRKTRADLEAWRPPQRKTKARRTKEDAT